MKTVEERFWAKVEKTESCWNWTASRSGNGYGQIGQSGRMRPAHRVSYELANGPIPDGLVIDHRCHNLICVNPAHLRAVSQKQNQENLRGASGRTGVRGVYPVAKSAGTFFARVKHNGKAHYLGTFPTLSEAEAAVTAKRNELFTCNDLDRGAK